MFCPNCGKEIPDTSKFCPECGKEIVAANKGSEVVEVVEHPYTDHEIKHDGTKNTNESTNQNSHKGLAVAGLILAIFIPVVGLILSCVSLSYYSKTDKTCGEYKMSVAGVIIGSIFSAFIVLGRITKLF